MVHHSMFSTVVNLFITVNVIQMGLATDIQGGLWDTLWDVSEQFFTTFFFLEFVLKAWALQCTYFHEGWNCFDMFIVMISVVGTWVMPTVAGKNEQMSDLIAMPRMLRLLRMLRMMRVIPQFRVLFDGILTSFHAMFWVALLSLFVLYMFGVATVNILGRESSGFSNFNDDPSALIADTENQALGWNNYQYFGTVARAIMTLLNLVVLCELDTIVRPVWEVQPLIAMILMALAFLFTFCFFNILIGMIMDSVMQSVKSLESETTRKERRMQMNYAHELADILFEAESHNRHDFSAMGRDEIDLLVESVNGLGLPHGFSFMDLIDMFDPDGSGQGNSEDCLDCIFNLVTNSEFQNNCLLQKGIGQVKRKIHDLHLSLRRDMATQHERLISEVRQLLLREPAARSLPAPPSIASAIAEIVDGPAGSRRPKGKRISEVSAPLQSATSASDKAVCSPAVPQSTDQDPCLGQALSELESALAATTGYLSQAVGEHELAGAKLQEAQLILECMRPGYQAGAVMEDPVVIVDDLQTLVQLDSRGNEDVAASGVDAKCSSRVLAVSHL